MRRMILAAVLLLSACEAYHVGDYRERFPIAVQRDTPVLLLTFEPNRAELGQDATARLDRFLASYMQQNSGPLTITAQRVPGNDRLAFERLHVVERRAVAAGIPKSVVHTTLGDGGTPGGDAVLTFERYTAQVPECGDWTKNSAVDWTNTPSSNFGCATQRYIGLMAADPRDLAAGRAAGARDAAHMSDQIGKWRAGAPTVATPQDPTAWKNYFNPTTGAAGQD
jgi:pilus assembly protein CpaD